MADKAPPPAWREPLDRVLGGIETLDDTLRAMPGHDAMGVSRQLRTANRKLWSITNSLEAAHTVYLYDTYSMLRAMASNAMLDMAELWVALVESGVLTINHRKLVELAPRHGVNPEDYLIHEEEEDAQGQTHSEPAQT